MKTSKRTILIPIGLLIICTSQIVAHYTKLSDFVMGATTGIGIGLMVVSLIMTKKKTASH